MGPLIFHSNIEKCDGIEFMFSPSSKLFSHFYNNTNKVGRVTTAKVPVRNQVSKFIAIKSIPYWKSSNKRKRNILILTSKHKWVRSCKMHHYIQQLKDPRVALLICNIRVECFRLIIVLSVQFRFTSSTPHPLFSFLCVQPQFIVLL